MSTHLKKILPVGYLCINNNILEKGGISGVSAEKSSGASG